MNVNIQANSPEPIYEQLVRQIHEGVASGALKPGEALPTVRQLAGDLRLNRNTVARAYKMLEDQGVILTAGRKGSFVRREASREVTRLKAGQAQRIVRQVVETLFGEGLSGHEISRLVGEAVRAGAVKAK
jgi:GntR family transcriptional regulator